jgi:DNA-directed RNA polymerase subunit RPC12/RpoP
MAKLMKCRNKHEFKVSDFAFKNWDNNIACPRCGSKVLNRIPTPRKEEGENKTLF